MRFSLRGIAEDLKSLEDLTMQCMKCGLCQAVCPLYEKDLVETSVSRGKISLIELLYQGKLKESDNIFKYIDYCILCGRCMRSCPSGVRTDEIILRARHTLRKINKLPRWQKAILETVIKHPELIAEIQPILSIGINLASSTPKENVKSLKFPTSRNIASVKPISFTSIHGGLNKAKNEQMRVIFYPGCAITFMYINWGKAVVETLKHFGVSVYVPKVNKCCGIPAATTGDIHLYERMVKENIGWFNSIKDASYIITSCPTCQYALGDLAERMGVEKSKVPMVDIIVFLSDVLNVDIKGFDVRATLHIPCHYDHTKDETLSNFVKSNISTNFNPLENQNCCGFGGTFNLKYYSDSLKVGEGKINEIREKGYEVLLTPCPGCAMQLTDLTVKAGCNVDIRHPIELIYQSIKEQKNEKE